MSTIRRPNYHNHHHHHQHTHSYSSPIPNGNSTNGNNRNNGNECVIDGRNGGSSSPTTQSIMLSEKR